MAGWHTDQERVADLPPVEDTLDDNPFDDDLGERLEALAPRPAATRTTLVLVGLVVLVAGFIGGVLVQKNFGATTTSTTGLWNVPNFAAAPGGQVRGNQTSAAASVTTGTVKLVNGTTIYVTLPNGDIATVKTTDKTVVAVEESAALKSLKAGQTVSVQGTAGSDGIITATRVTAEK